MTVNFQTFNTQFFERKIKPASSDTLTDHSSAPQRLNDGILSHQDYQSLKTTYMNEALAQHINQPEAEQAFEYFLADILDGQFDFTFSTQFLESVQQLAAHPDKPLAIQFKTTPSSSHPSTIPRVGLLRDAGTAGQDKPANFEPLEPIIIQRPLIPSLEDVQKQVLYKQMQDCGVFIPPTLGSLKPVCMMNTQEKAWEIMQLLPKHLDEQTAQQLKDLMTEENIAFATSAVGLYIASHCCLAGEAADATMIGLTALGALGLGSEVGEAASELYQFVTLASSAKTLEDLDQATEHLGKVIATIEIDVLMVLLAKKGIESSDNILKLPPQGLTLQTASGGSISLASSGTVVGNFATGSSHHLAKLAVLLAKNNKESSSVGKSVEIPMTSSSSYVFKKEIDEDWRGTNKTLDEALNLAFEKTGAKKEEFEKTKWTYDKHGKSHPVEYKVLEGKNKGAEVNIDFPHFDNPDAPHLPHVGWQTSKPKTTGHIFLDNVPYNRPPIGKEQ